jgi:recombination-promoting nuclease RpnB
MLAETVKGWAKTWKAEGLAEGMEKGMGKTKLEIASAMLQKGLDKQVIIEVTGLSEDDILRLGH